MDFELTEQSDEITKFSFEHGFGRILTVKNRPVINSLRHAMASEIQGLAAARKNKYNQIYAAMSDIVGVATIGAQSY